jgi:hypothetical protein
MNENQKIPYSITERKSTEVEICMLHYKRRQSYNHAKSLLNRPLELILRLRVTIPTLQKLVA